MCSLLLKGKTEKRASQKAAIPNFLLLIMLVTWIRQLNTEGALGFPIIDTHRKLSRQEVLIREEWWKSTMEEDIEAPNVESIHCRLHTTRQFTLVVTQEFLFGEVKVPTEGELGAGKEASEEVSVAGEF